MCIRDRRRCGPLRKKTSWRCQSQAASCQCTKRRGRPRALHDCADTCRLQHLGPSGRGCGSRGLPSNQWSLHAHSLAAAAALCRVAVLLVTRDVALADVPRPDRRRQAEGKAEHCPAPRRSGALLRPSTPWEAGTIIPWSPLGAGGRRCPTAAVSYTHLTLPTILRV